MSVDLWLAFFATSFVLSLIPGPNMLLALSHGIRHGALPCIGTALGAIGGLVALMIASLGGIGALLAASATAFYVMKWAGAAYLVYLGVKTWRAPADSPVPDDVAIEDGAVGVLRRGAGRTAVALMGQAFLVSISNPKAIVFLTALFPQFVDPAQPLLPQALILGGTMAAGEFFWIMAYAGGGTRLVPLLARLGKAQLLNRLSGGFLIGAGVLLATVRR